VTLHRTRIKFRERIHISQTIGRARSSPYREARPAQDQMDSTENLAHSKTDRRVRSPPPILEAITQQRIRIRTIREILILPSSREKCRGKAGPLARASFMTKIVAQELRSIPTVARRQPPALVSQIHVRNHAAICARRKTPTFAPQYPNRVKLIYSFCARIHATVPSASRNFSRGKSLVFRVTKLNYLIWPKALCLAPYQVATVYFPLGRTGN